MSDDWLQNGCYHCDIIIVIDICKRIIINAEVLKSPSIIGNFIFSFTGKYVSALVSTKPKTKYD